MRKTAVSVAVPLVATVPSAFYSKRNAVVCGGCIVIIQQILSTARRPRVRIPV